MADAERMCLPSRHPRPHATPMNCGTGTSPCSWRSGSEADDEQRPVGQSQTPKAEELPHGVDDPRVRRAVVDLTHSDDDVVHVLTRCRSAEVPAAAAVGPRPPAPGSAPWREKV